MGTYVLRNFYNSRLSMQHSQFPRYVPPIAAEDAFETNNKTEKALFVSAVREIRFQDRKVSVAVQSDIWEQHAEIPGISDAVTKRPQKAKEVVAAACTTAADADLTICSVRLACPEASLRRRQWKKLSVWTDRLWRKAVRDNGLLITVWSGAGEGHNGMVGVALKRESLHDVKSGAS